MCVTYDDEELLDLLHSPLQLHAGPVLGVLHRNQHVELVVQVLPVRLAAIQVLLCRVGDIFREFIIRFCQLSFRKPKP